LPFLPSSRVKGNPQASGIPGVTELADALDFLFKEEDSFGSLVTVPKTMRPTGCQAQERQRLAFSPETRHISQTFDNQRFHVFSVSVSRRALNGAVVGTVICWE
jgi:hypothetical protein